MADLILSPVVDTIISKLISATAEQISNAVNWKQELTKLQNKLKMIQAVLKDAEERQVRDPAVKLWLEKLRDVAREADDVLDEVAYESVKRKLLIQNQMKKKLGYFFTLSNPIAFRIRMANKIKSLIALVSDINNEAQQFGLQPRLAAGTVSQYRRNPQTHSLVGDVSQIVGRDDDISKIVHFLTESTDQLPLSVLSIVGMPGLGKTALAQCVRNNEKIQKYFGKVMWVCVSENFDAERIVVEMLESLTKSSCAIRNKDTVVQTIREELGENKFLLVLDDVWNEESEKWKDLESCLLGIYRKLGNRVVVTTRSESVALKMGTRAAHMHHLGQLKDDECWSIIKRRVFRDDPAPPELVEIGRNIAKKCEGVPLVASVIGGTLCIKRPDTVEWLSIESKIDELGPLEHNNGIMPVIQLSFDRLPNPALKQCFAFCSIFPKDHVMEKEILIQLWMAEGDGQLHTLFLKNGFSRGMSGNFRRLRVLSFCDATDTEEFPPCFGNMKSLRYLDISRTRIAALPKFVTELYNLQTFRFMNCRSLKMPANGIKNLINLRHILFSHEEQMPANIGRLTCLQTLPLFCVGATKGRKIEELGFLRLLKGRLFISNLELVKDKPEAMGAKLHEKQLYDLTLKWGKEGNHDKDVLEGLQPHASLQRLRVEGYGGKNFPSWMLNNLLELTIKSCEKLENIPIIGFSSLKKLEIDQCKKLTGIAVGTTEFTSLKELSIQCCAKLESIPTSALPSIQTLNIKNCEGLSSIGDSLSKCLEHIPLKDCPNLRFLPSMDGLTSLKSLRLSSCDGFEYLPRGLSSCTALERLNINACNSLVSIPEELKDLRSLVNLEITNCSRLRSIPEKTLNCLTGLKRLGIGGFSVELEEFPGLNSIHHLQASLEGLELCGWEKLTEVPRQIQHLAALKSLCIIGFNQIETLPEWLGEVPFSTSLEELTIRNCSNLVSIPKEIIGRLARLKKLDMGPFSEELEEFPGLSSIHHLKTSLEELSLHGWEKLTQLPHQIQDLRALRYMYINGFQGMEALPEWLEKLSSLQDLRIVKCKNLKYLPSAKAIRCLSKLKVLLIGHCPELEIRCTKERGPEWSKISHIPDISINSEDI
ncbi:hypothetical protein SLEP1_g27879 [Rubroshorea leprosula]|uniref:Disease resistance protein RGA3 n=1 Tax=Rubroshorea leprosula TaxID=152421 RepID=A0AAV5K4G3_9ROSI|nr:hypothetical protein SLEP1_g27879 [Rubroshorea leprosula]